MDINQLESPFLGSQDKVVVTAGGFVLPLAGRLRLGSLRVPIHQPNKHWACDVDRTVGTDDYTKSQTERKTVNSFTADCVQNDHHKECC